MKIDKTLVASIALHALVIGWSVITFSARSLEAPPQSMPVDIISSDQFSKITAGVRTGKKENPKPLVEKVADAAPVDDTVGKITEKKEIITAATPHPPKPVKKRVEKKPDPPKRTAENKPKDKPKPAEKKPDRSKIDPIAEALKAEKAKKPPAKRLAKAARPRKRKREPVFDEAKIAALLDKRDPTHQAITGATLNAAASLGSMQGHAATLSQSELDAMRARLASLWDVQPDVERPKELDVTVRIRLGRDRRLIGLPQVVSTGTSPRYQAAAEAAVRAVIEGQPYDMLRSDTYDQWKYMDIDFDPTQMFHS
ncbi:MAG: protein TolA [Bradyrhizobium sp.]